MWQIGEEEITIPRLIALKVEKLNGKIDGTDYQISGWIGAAEVPSDLRQDEVNNNKSQHIM